MNLIPELKYPLPVLHAYNCLDDFNQEYAYAFLLLITSHPDQELLIKVDAVIDGCTL